MHLGVTEYVEKYQVIVYDEQTLKLLNRKCRI